MPKKPFPTYHWQWASVTPTEGLNEPPIFLGVLRVLSENEGKPFSSPDIEDGLRRVEAELEGRVTSQLNLVRANRKRNLFRNSQQYWKALGLLATSRGVELTTFGKEVAEGRIARDEFATIIVKTLELPSPAIQSAPEVNEWNRHGLYIKPLQLILSIMRDLGRSLGDGEAYLTREELTRIVIPLAGDRRSTPLDYIEAISLFRAGKLDTSGWPNCVPGDNDARMAGEFLRFLAFYGFCIFDGVFSPSTKLFIEMREQDQLSSLLAMQSGTIDDASGFARLIREQTGAGFVERQRAMREVLLRPQQSKFRNEVLSAFRSSCFLTGERIPQILEAAHIVPVQHSGVDSRGNGLCLRSDIHSLYDSGHIRLSPAGTISYSDSVLASRNYRALPRTVTFPRFIDRACLEWRYNYQ